MAQAFPHNQGAFPHNQGTFLRNQWYVVATSAELTDQPIGRRICNQPLALFRRTDGSPAVIADRCGHRKFPLSRGRVVGDDIECGYHGIRFAGNGRCTLVPSQETLPKGLDVRAYAVAEGSALVWVWMGEADQADYSLLPRIIENDGPGWEPVFGYHHVNANYQLVVDNLLDLTHLAIVHKTTLAGPGLLENPLQVTVEGDVVRGLRTMPNVDPAPIFRVIRDFPGRIDRRQSYSFHLPSHVFIRVGAVPAGSNEDIEVPHHVVINHLVPETETTTHYFWSVSRCMAVGDAEVSKRMYAMNRMAFDEDMLVLAAQQEMLADDPDGGVLANVDGDRAAAAARRIVRRRLAEEAPLWEGHVGGG
jgi:vanillate O-demethylase monooxygenase subunit